jgi:hypothetical protein
MQNSLTATGVLKVITLLTSTLAIMSTIMTLMAFGTSSVTKPRDGYDCWDTNQNGRFDSDTEDIYPDGIGNYRDCSVTRGIDGTNGTNGTECWDTNGNALCDTAEDLNFDGVCNSTDCFVVCKGIDCWDLNGNGECDLLTEDITHDGICSAADCKGLNGVDGCSCYQCWDLDLDGYCTLPDEDINSDGVCNITGIGNAPFYLPFRLQRNEWIQLLGYERKLTL